MKLLLRLFLGSGFTLAGILHFIREKNFTKIVPAYLPFKKEIVYISGVIEVIMGLYLLMRKPGNKVKKLINLFLLAVFPANIYMARKGLPLGEKQLPKAVLYSRLPLQFILIKMIKSL